MSEQRPQHTREPAEGSNQDVQAAGAQRAGETDKGAHGAQQSPPHTEEPAEGSDEEADTPGAEQARDDD